MKLIIAIIQPNRLEAVKEALTHVEVVRLTVMDCQGFGRQKGHTEVYRGREFAVNLLRKVQLQFSCHVGNVLPSHTCRLQQRTSQNGHKDQVVAPMGFDLFRCNARQQKG